MSTIVKAFVFRVYSEAEHKHCEFQLLVNENGWAIGDVRGLEQFDSFGPKTLGKGIVIPEATRKAMSELFESRAGVSDRIFQSRLAAIANSMSGALREA
jgi:hypothetical protein